MSDTVKLNDEEENLELLEGFTLLDDEFMTIVFDRNTEATELLLNIILGRNDMEVTEVAAQRNIRIRSWEAVLLSSTFMPRVLTEKCMILS